MACRTVLSRVEIARSTPLRTRWPGVRGTQRTLSEDSEDTDDSSEDASGRLVLLVLAYSVLTMFPKGAHTFLTFVQLYVLGIDYGGRVPQFATNLRSGGWGGGDHFDHTTRFLQIAGKWWSVAPPFFWQTFSHINFAHFQKISAQCHVISGHQVRSSDPTSKYL